MAWKASKCSGTDPAAVKRLLVEPTVATKLEGENGRRGRRATFSRRPSLICARPDDLDLTLKPPPPRAWVPYQEYHVSQKFVNIISNCPESIRSKVLIMQSGNLRPPGSTFLGPFRRKVSVWTGARFRLRRPPQMFHTAV